MRPYFETQQADFFTALGDAKAAPPAAAAAPGSAAAPAPEHKDKAVAAAGGAPVLRPELKRSPAAADAPPRPEHKHPSGGAEPWLGASRDLAALEREERALGIRTEPAPRRGAHLDVVLDADGALGLVERDDDDEKDGVVDVEGDDDDDDDGADGAARATDLGPAGSTEDESAENDDDVVCVGEGGDDDDDGDDDDAAGSARLRSPPEHQRPASAARCWRTARSAARAYCPPWSATACTQNADPAWARRHSSVSRVSRSSNSTRSWRVIHAESSARCAMRSRENTNGVRRAAAGDGIATRRRSTRCSCAASHSSTVRRVEWVRRCSR
jgi:hypothetical protein